MAYKEATFPEYYREAEIRQITRAICKLRSIAVHGLAGMGKSNIFRYLVSNPAVKNYLGNKAAYTTFVFVDGNKIDALNEQAVLEKLDEQFTKANVPAARTRARRSRDAVRQLRAQIENRIEQLDSQQILVMLFDSFDEASKNPNASFFKFLRGLREDGQIAFIFGSRRPYAPLLELEELFVEPCWIKPLNARDAFDSLARDQARLGSSSPNSTRAQLFDLTGGHPGLLKNAAELAEQHAIHLDVEREVLVDEFLATSTINEACRDLWDDLSSSEQRTLMGAISGGMGLDAECMELLHDAGLLVAEADGEVKMFSPIFKKYVRTKIARKVRVTIGPHNTASIESWQGTVVVDLPPTEFHILHYMARHPNQLHQKSLVSDAVWPNQWPLTRETLERHTQRARARLDKSLQSITGDKVYQSIISVRSRGYQLNTTAAGNWKIEFEASA